MNRACVVALLLENELVGILDAPGILTIEGTATGADINDDGRASTLIDGMWTGNFSEDMVVIGDVDGTFTGAL